MARPPSTRKTLTNLVLLILEKTVDSYVEFDDFIHHPLWERPIKKSALSQVIARLREQGLVELISDDKLSLKLTDSGIDKALWLKMRHDSKKWDGRWRLVIWDIPEKRRLTRDLLRFKLKQLGFIQWQQSVWASKVNCTDVLRDFIRKTGIGDWVMVVESDNVGV